MDYHLKSLEEKLNILASGEEIGLTPEEAAVYGIEYVDTWPEEESEEEDEYEE